MKKILSMKIGVFFSREREVSENEGAFAQTSNA
jgi:hypothetical protein